MMTNEEMITNGMSLCETDLSKQENVRKNDDFDLEQPQNQDLQKSRSDKEGCTISNSSDAFAPRRGHTLTWSNVSLKIEESSSRGLSASSESPKTEKVILDNVAGRIEPQQLVGLMGHSGSSKTSLLNVLSGKVSTVANTIVHREMTLDGVEIDPSSIHVKRKIAYVGQRDILLATATPREAIRFSARLRLPSHVSDAEIEEITDRILKELHLSHVADTMTGGEHFRGLSGGEMRRLSLGVELVVRPSILFADEPTSGLDSHNAASVMKVLKKVADCGASVLVTIHQPSSRVFTMMDKLILMKQGKVMYQGVVADVTQYFSARGYEVPQNFNPADWILEVSETTTVADLTSAGFFDEKANHDDEASSRPSMLRKISSYFGGSQMLRRISSRRSVQHKRISIFETLDASSRASLWTEVRMQVVREFQKVVRDGHAMKLRFTIIVLGSAIIAIAYQGTASSPHGDVASFSSHVGAAMFLIISCMVAIQVFVLDQVEARPLFVREFETDHFRMASHGLAKVATEAIVCFLQVLTFTLIVYWAIDLQGRFWYLLIVLYGFAITMAGAGICLASLTTDPRDARELIPMTMLPQILFCGFFVRIEDLPVFLQWLQWLWPLTYAFRLFLNEEFSNCVEQEKKFEGADACFRSFSNLLSNDDGGDQFRLLLNENSTVHLPQTGKFEGVEGITEYIGFFSADHVNAASLLEDTCRVEDSLSFKFNGYNEESGLCDLTISQVAQGRMNEKLINDEYVGQPFVQYTNGFRVYFRHSNDVQTSAIANMDIYLPQEFTAGFVANVANVTTGAEMVCDTMRDYCPESYTLDNYMNQNDCVARMLSIPHVTTNKHGLATADANTTTCRFVHSALARTDKTHCPHVSFYPEEDKNGYIKCGAGNDFSYSDFFSDEDMDFFETKAEEYGLGEKQAVYSLTNNETLPCHPGTFTLSQDIEKVIPNDFVASSVCTSYLESQNATGDRNLQYWFTLLAMYLSVRIFGLYCLRKLVAKSKMA